MRRPRTIPGLVWLWLRMRPRRLVALGLIGAAIASAWSWSEGCPVEADPWRAGLDQYDYLQHLSLRGDGTGDYAYGYAQAVRFEARFRYRVLDGERLELREFVEIDHEGTEHLLDWPPQRVDYRLDEGRYCFHPPYGSEQCYRCELTLGPSLLPSASGDFYACPAD